MLDLLIKNGKSNIGIQGPVSVPMSQASLSLRREPFDS